MNNNRTGQHLFKRRITVDRPVYTQENFDREYRDQASKTSAGVRLKLKTYLSSLTCSRDLAVKFFYSVFPILQWLPKYKVKSFLFKDIISGSTVAIMNIPQGMGFALLASLMPINGIYVSFFAPMVYALTGSSRHLAIGTFAVVSLMSGSAVERVVPLGVDTTQADDTGYLIANSTIENSTAAQISLYDREQEKVLASAALAFLIGIFQLLMGLCQLGFVSIYLSNPLVRAFTTGAACHVAVSQAKYLFGISEYVGNYSGIFSIIYALIDILGDIGKTNYVDFILSLVSLIILAIIKLINTKYKEKIKIPIPIELIVVILFTLISWLLNLSTNNNVGIIGAIPTGIPPPQLPGFYYLPQLIGDAFAIAIVSLSISFSMSRLLAEKHNYQFSPNVELRSYGLVNLVSSFFQCFPSGGSLSRSIVQEQTGGQTQVASLVNSAFLLVVLLAIGPLFQSLPKSILATIILINLRGIFMQFTDLVTLWKKDRYDWVVWLLTFLGTVLLGVDLGLLVGVAAAIFSVILRLQLAPSSLLGNLHSTELYRDFRNVPAASKVAGVKIFYYEAPLFYANALDFTNKLKKAIGVDQLMARQNRVEVNEEITDDSLPESTAMVESSHLNGPTPGGVGVEVHTVVLDMGTCSFLDTVGTQTLLELSSCLRQKYGITLLLANCSERVLYHLKICNEESEEKIKTYISIHDAVTESINLQSIETQV